MLIPAARLAGVPVVIGSHRQLGDLLTPLQFRAQNIVLRMCDAIVCNSRAATARLQKSGLGEQKVTVIPNALPHSAFAETIPAMPSEPVVLRIGMIARMNDRSKNHVIFLRAAARLAAKFQCVEFVLVGDGPLRPELETLVRELELGSRVRFLGDRHDIPEVLASLNITVLPSSSESSSNAIVESIAAGIPVVASDVSGNTELEARGWDCQVMNINENRRVRSPQYIDVQSGWDYFWKVARLVWRGYAVHIRVNGETKKGYLLALSALLLARVGRRAALLTYAGGHQQTYFPAPRGSLRHLAFSLLFRVADLIYCNSSAVN